MVVLGLGVHEDVDTNNYPVDEDMIGACMELLGFQLPNGHTIFVQITQLRRNLLQA